MSYDASYDEDEYNEGLPPLDDDTEPYNPHE